MTKSQTPSTLDHRLVVRFFEVLDIRHPGSRPKNRVPYVLRKPGFGHLLSHKHECENELRFNRQKKGWVKEESTSLNVRRKRYL